MIRKIYADYAATSPLCSEAKEAMIHAMECFGNPSSLHSIGRTANKIVEKARVQVASAINADPSEIYFTSGATEANVWALSNQRFPMVSSIEHSSVLNKPGRYPTLLKADKYGFVVLPEEPPFLFDRFSRTSLCSVMYVNNETGVIQDIKRICSWAHKNNMWFHTDATQAVGHIPVDVKEIGCDMLSMSAHKFGGPKGVGALFIRGGYKKAPVSYGGGQENGLRAGTENVIGIAGMGAAIEWYSKNLQRNMKQMSIIRNKIIDDVLEIHGSHLTGHRNMRSPAIASFVFDGVEGTALVLALDERGVCASSGSACHEGSVGISHVLKAMGYTEGNGKGSLRISIGPGTTMEDASYIAWAVKESVEELRK